MSRKRHRLSAFNLAFLDIMSCGFGAVILLFLIVKHNVDASIPVTQTTPNLTAEISLLEKESIEGQKDLAELRNTNEEILQRIVIAQGLARRIEEESVETAGKTETISAAGDSDTIEKLKASLKKLDAQKKSLETKNTETGKDTRRFVGDGDREYLTGLKLGGKRILVLLDASASMLDETIINIIRRRNMSNAIKLQSPKWQQALATVDWLSARFPVDSRYQIYTFNTQITPVLTGTKGQWLNVKDLGQLNKAIDKMKEVIPEDGTSLENAFLAANKLRPLPDNIYLITDGLPTQGKNKPRGSKVSGNQRLKYFNSAAKQLPQGVPINTILLPIEGDPIAASAFWQMAQATQGSMLTPTEDWP